MCVQQQLAFKNGCEFEEVKEEGLEGGKGREYVVKL